MCLAYHVPANSTLSFYTVSLPSLVGPAYQAPGLATLAYYWNESAGRSTVPFFRPHSLKPFPVGDVRNAAKLLFENEISRLSDDSIGAIAERWRHKRRYSPEHALQPIDLLSLTSALHSSRRPAADSQGSVGAEYMREHRD